MAQLRLIVATAWVAACAASEAAPPPAQGSAAQGSAAQGSAAQGSASSGSPVIPKGWRVDPALAKAAADAVADPKQPAIAVTASEAWSEPARGCFGFRLELRGGAAPIDAAADQLLAALASELAGAKLHDVAKPAAGEHGTLALAFDRPPYHGKLRAELARTGEVQALACAWNQREPKACEAGCTVLFGGAK